MWLRRSHSTPERKPLWSLPQLSYPLIKVPHSQELLKSNTLLLALPRSPFLPIPLLYTCSHPSLLVHAQSPCSLAMTVPTVCTVPRITIRSPALTGIQQETACAPFATWESWRIKLKFCTLWKAEVSQYQASLGCARGELLAYLGDIVVWL